MNKDNSIHMFIGPRIKKNMTVSELNSARSLAKYSISRDFPNIEEFTKFTSQFQNEKQLLTSVYQKESPIYDLCGEDLSVDLCIQAHDNKNNKVPITYKIKQELSEEAKKELYKWYNNRMKSKPSKTKNNSNDDGNGLWRPTR